jgi:hypothetical protein
MKTPHTIHSDVKFKALELIDVQALERATKEQWFNQTLCEVNDSVVRLGVLKSSRAGSASTSKAARWSSRRSRASRCRGASCIARGRPSAPWC